MFYKPLDSQVFRVKHLLWYVWHRVVYQTNACCCSYTHPSDAKSASVDANPVQAAWSTEVTAKTVNFFLS